MWRWAASVGLFLLHQMRHLPINTGLYRDDGLAVSALTERQTDKLKPAIKKVFEHNGLSIQMVVNIKIVNFLDVTFNLETGLYSPFMKHPALRERGQQPSALCHLQHPPGGQLPAGQHLQQQGGV